MARILLTGLALGVSAIFVIFLLAPASAQDCSTRAAVLALLFEGHGELPVAAGLASSGALVELVRTVNGSTWTIIVTTPTKLTCVVASGEDWQPVCREARK